MWIDTDWFEANKTGTSLEVFDMDFSNNIQKKSNEQEVKNELKTNRSHKILQFLFESRILGVRFTF